MRANQIERIIGTVNRHFTLPAGAEITLEGNPREFASAQYLREVRAAGVNRVSLGYQSSQETILRTALNSPHDVHEGRRAVENALSTGFRTVNVDTLYRVPTQTEEQWVETIDQVIAFGPQGVTTYAYVIYAGSATEKLLARGQLDPQVDAEAAHSWYHLARKRLELHGYVEGRKGSFAKPGHEQRYGALSYGQGCETLGVGAGAFSFVGGYQYASPANGEVYKEMIRANILPPVVKVSDRADDRQLMERFATLNLLSSEISRSAFRDRFGVDPTDAFRDAVNRLVDVGLLTVEPTRIRLTDEGMKWRYDVIDEFSQRN